MTIKSRGRKKERGNLNALLINHLAAVCRNARSYALLGCAVGGVLEANHCIRLGTFLTLDDVEFDLIALFQRFVTVQLNRGVVNEYIRPVFTPDESVALGIIKPLYFPFILSHRLPPSLHREEYAAQTWMDSRAATTYDVQIRIKVDYVFLLGFHNVRQRATSRD